jgi:hypothetical protein
MKLGPSGWGLPKPHTPSQGKGTGSQALLLYPSGQPQSPHIHSPWAAQSYLERPLTFQPVTIPNLNIITRFSLLSLGLLTSESSHFLAGCVSRNPNCVYL